MSKTLINTHMKLLGLKVQDRVTGLKGIVSSISFDLYGCVQATITTPADKNNVKGTNYWHDVARLKILSKIPVMELPNFHYGVQAEGRQGCAEKMPLH